QARFDRAWARFRACTSPGSTSKDRARVVRRGVRVAGDDVVDLSYDRLHLGDSGAREGDRVSHEGCELVGGEAEPGVGGQPVEHVVLRLALAYVEGDTDGGILDCLVGD